MKAATAFKRAAEVRQERLRLAEAAEQARIEKDAKGYIAIIRKAIPDMVEQGRFTASVVKLHYNEMTGGAREAGIVDVIRQTFEKDGYRVTTYTGQDETGEYVCVEVHWDKYDESDYQYS